MKTFSFTIILAENDITDEQANALYEIGCNDGIPLVGCGRASISFDREAESIKDATELAIQQIKDVGLTPIAVQDEQEWSKYQ